MAEFLLTIATMALCFCFAVVAVALVSGITLVGFRKLSEVGK